MTKEEKDLRDFLQEWKNNPLHWSNNKRKFKKLSTLRKPINNKFRFHPSIKLFELLDAYFIQEMKTRTNELIDCCTDIRSIKLGDR